MSGQNPYQAPVGDKPPETVRIAKAFSYLNAPETKGIVFHGAIFASPEGLFICHDKHTRQSAGTAAAAFGLIGVAIHYLMTRNKTFDYPFPVLPVDELPDSIRVRMAEHKFTQKSVVSIIPFSDIDNFVSGVMKGKRFSVGKIEINLVSPIKKGLKLLSEMGFPVE